jgi:hypothetical protein
MFSLNANSVGAASPGFILAAAKEMIALHSHRGAHAVGVEVKQFGSTGPDSLERRTH